MGKGKQNQLLYRGGSESVTKEQAAEYLRGLGYDAIEEDGLVLVRLPEVPTAQERFKILSHLREINYSSSFGWQKVRKGGEE